MTDKQREAIDLIDWCLSHIQRGKTIPYDVDGIKVALSQQPVGEEEIAKIICKFMGWPEELPALGDARCLAAAILARFNISDRGK